MGGFPIQRSSAFILWFICYVPISAVLFSHCDSKFFLSNTRLPHEMESTLKFKLKGTDVAHPAAYSLRGVKQDRINPSLP